MLLTVMKSPINGALIFVIEFYMACHQHAVFVTLIMYANEVAEDSMLVVLCRR